MNVKRFYPLASSSTLSAALFVSIFQQKITAWMPAAVSSRHSQTGAWRALSSDSNIRSRSSSSSRTPTPWHRNSQSAPLQVPSTSSTRPLYDRSRNPSSRRFLSSPDMEEDITFKAGDAIQVEVISFGPLGASVSVVGLGHDGDLLSVDGEPYAYGLILQKEIAYFREARDNVDVVRGEVLPAYVEKVRLEDGKLDVGLRAFGGKAKADQINDQILKKLEASPNGTLSVGDKSTPVEINQEFPGVSKSVFKKAVGALYKKGLVAPLPNSISLTKNKTRQ